MKDKLTKHHQKKGHFTKRKFLIITLATLAILSATTVPFSVALTKVFASTTQQNS